MLLHFPGGLTPNPSDVKGQIDFRNVTFSYPTRKESHILSGLNLSVPAGSVTAVVGASGSGKSTLSSLLMRFYDPNQGKEFCKVKGSRSFQWSYKIAQSFEDISGCIFFQIYNTILSSLHVVGKGLKKSFKKGGRLQVDACL